MERQAAAQLLRDELDKNALVNWKVRLTSNINQRFLALCSYKDQCIIINAHHIDLHDEKEIINTIRHEIAHALVGPGHGHNSIWADKAKEIGCYDNSPCSHYGLPEHIIDAIRSGAEVEVEFDEQIIRTPKYKVTRLQDKCPYCGKVAKSKSEKTVISSSETGQDLKIIVLECGHTLIKKIPKGTPFHSLVSNVNNKPAVKECGHEWNKNKCNKCGEYRPFEFQTEGMKFIESALSIQSGVLIADEMGLGKTIQALGYLAFHPEDLPVLFVVKSSIKFQWLKQIMIWMGDRYFAQVISNSNEYLLPKLKCYIISYDMMVFKARKNKKTGELIKQGFDISKFDAIGIKTVVLDECQQIKNPDSSRTQQVRRLVKGRKVIALSGTPWKNKGTEFFSILNMIDPIKFYSYTHYIDRWVQTYYHGNVLKYGGIQDPDKFKEFVKDIVIRRERTEVMKELPLVNRMRLYIQLDEINQDEYDDAVSDFVKWYNDAVLGGEEDQLSGMNILAKMSRMRHIAGLAKIPATIEFAKDFIEETERKLVIFVHHKDVGSLIYDQLTKELPDTPIMKLTGEMNGIERFQTQEKFNGTGQCILVASTLAAGEGLNLQTGADCIIHERQWNPANEEQAEGRFIRIGQTANSVNATYPLGEGTIDDLFDEIVERKRDYFQTAMNKSVRNEWDQSNLGKELAEGIIKRFKAKQGGKKLNKDMVKV